MRNSEKTVQYIFIRDITWTLGLNFFVLYHHHFFLKKTEAVLIYGRDLHFKKRCYNSKLMAPRYKET